MMESNFTRENISFGIEVLSAVEEAGIMGITAKNLVVSCTITDYYYRLQIR